LVGGSTVDLALLPKSTNLLAEPLDMQDTSDIQDQAGRVVLCPGSTCVLPQDDAHMPSNRDEAVELGSTFGADSSGSPTPASSLAPALTLIALQADPVSLSGSTDVDDSSVPRSSVRHGVSNISQTAGPYVDSTALPLAPDH
jgi:hypothetical protein